MANTVSLLSYANTFGDWVVVTNALAKENNDLASNNYVKPTGTLFLNSPSLGLQVGNNAIIGGQLQVQGIGSSAYVQNNLRVDTQVYFQNTVLGLTNSGELISNGRISASGSNIGLAVANNTTIGGFLTVNRFLNVSGNTSISNTLSVLRSATLSNTLTVIGDADFVANVAIDDYLTVVQEATVGKLTVGTSTTTDTLSVTNGAAVGGQLAVTGNTALANNLLVSNRVTSTSLQANSSVNTATISVTGTSFTNALQANSSVNTAVLSVTGNTFTNTLTVNTSIVVPNMTLSGTTLNAVGATGNFDALTTTGNVTVGGNFTITGQTVYATNTFTLSAGVGSPITSFYNVFRPSANTASIRWNEVSDYWDMNNVNTGIFYRVLTDEFRSDLTTSGGTTNIATSNAVFYLQGALNTANTNLTNTNGLFQGINNSQNTRMAIIEAVDATQNTRLNSIETNNVNQNTSISIIQGVDVTQNTRLNAIETINNNQNTSITIIQSVDNTQNVQIAGIQGVDNTQNTRIQSIETINNNQNTTITQVNQYAASAYAYANTLPTPSGTNATGTWAIGISGTAAAATTVTGVAQLAGYSVSGQNIDLNGAGGPQVTGQGGGAAMMSFHRPGSYAINFGLGTDNQLRTGGWSRGGNFVLLDSGNYNSYAPTLGGTGASGTWSINVTGNSGTSTLASKASTLSQNGGNGAGMTFFWSGQSGQPTWLWGSNDGTSHFVYNPANFNVNYANSAGTAGNITSFTINQSLGTGNNVQHNSLGIGTGSSGTTGEIRATNNITAYFSDERLKKKLGNIDNALDKLLTLSGFYYEPNETAQALGYKVKKEVGLSAQEVQRILPEVVVPAPIDEKYLTIHYEKLIPLLVEAIKELKQEIDELKNKN